ncbi:DUF5683 domain-containing protein [Bacteroides zoogleoformans]|uniref:DUF5683 domain-containing protein n=1 Tax=Bacteroides zoogleoformans TaxID=28119 RepID=A0ABN5IHK1_9BACE|nr:DUF5683 domain-containing protein [Bacteroides zoogleoformans]AVM52214.1 hypothetical protein C4H11_03955 [Bacteroides zoogleoformans]
MRKKRIIYQLTITLLFCLLQTTGIVMYGQDRPRAASKRIHRQLNDTVSSAHQPIHRQADSLNIEISQPEESGPSAYSDSLAIADSLATENKRKLLEMTAGADLPPQPIPTDSLQKALKTQTWIPNPTTATWLALVIPGGGQIYNRKFWKLPIFYGGFAGCAYALTWNNKMYKDYSAAYKDASNGNWTSTNITELLPPNHNYSNSQLLEVLRKRKDTYRRFRDLSIFAFIGVYLLSVVDAYVDAELSNFDITPDLSMRVEPAIINNQMIGSSQRAVGMQCSFRF